MSRFVCFFGAAMAMAQQPPPEAVFHSGTRLVEVEAVVRSQRVRPTGVGEWLKWTFDSGPPWGPPGDVLTGLTRDDFTLLDDGKPQQIAVFRAGPGSAETMAVPPGAVSNRQDSRGRPVNGATVVLIDFLNVGWGNSEYARLGMKNLLHSFAETDGTAVYTLGLNLHLLQDFHDDPQKLLDATALLDTPGMRLCSLFGAHCGKLPPEFSSALWDYGDLPTAFVDQAAAVHAKATIKAVKTIVQHLSGMPGRKSLVWLMPAPSVPPAIMSMLQQANIALYPVPLRCQNQDCQDAARHLAGATGGRAFFDAMDLTFAVGAAKEDPRAAYVLGFYPAEDTLDGRYHNISVKLANKTPAKQAVEIDYRTGYLATKAALPGRAQMRELSEDPVDSAKIGLVGQTTPDARHPGLYDVHVTIDLHDIHLDSNDNRFTGAFDFSVPNPSSKNTVKTGIAAIDLTVEQLAEALESGFNLVIKGVEPESGEIRVAVRDRATGIAGSLRIPIAEQAAK